MSPRASVSRPHRAIALGGHRLLGLFLGKPGLLPHEEAIRLFRAPGPLYLALPAFGLSGNGLVVGPGPPRTKGLARQARGSAKRAARDASPLGRESSFACIAPLPAGTAANRSRLAARRSVGASLRDRTSARRRRRAAMLEGISSLRACRAAMRARKEEMGARISAFSIEKAARRACSAGMRAGFSSLQAIPAERRGRTAAMTTRRE